MPLSTQPYKGARDFYPEDKRLQKFVFNKMRQVVEEFGYEEYDAPILEPTELYLSKGNEEIISDQTYTFKDRGDRSVTIRTEMTPTVSRMVAGKRQQLAYPLRWYSIPNLWRYERPQRGRLREFWQLNVDLFGVDNIKGDIELIQVADRILRAFGATKEMFVIKINSRKLMDFVFTDYLGLNEVQTHTLSRLIDKMHKIDKSQFVAESEAILSPSQRDDGYADKLHSLLEAKTIAQLPEEIRSHDTVSEIQEYLTVLNQLHITNVEFDITLMRGFDYYTGIVFEVFDTDPDNNRSIFGGGRYDGLVGLFGVEPVATVGFGMGDVSMQNFLTTHQLLPQIASETDVYVVFMGDVYEQAQHTVNELREMGLNIAVDLSSRKVDKQIKTASKKGIKYVLFIGEEEIQTGQYTLKDLTTGKEEKHSTSRLVSMIKDYRKNNFIIN